ncbi:MAG: UPF0236 family protein [Coriobacteriia bacterium]|jgi:hypothetical protein|nr:UPF0236 family protein [Coriobacteriia bacterium]
MIVRVDLGVVEFEIGAPTAALADRGLDEAVRVAQLTAIPQVFAQLESELLGSRDCPVCGAQLKVVKTSKRTIGFLCGETRVAVRTFSCACGHFTRPLDGVLPRGRHSLALVERGLYLASMLGYERSSKTLSRLTGGEISHGSLQRRAKAEAPYIDEAIEAATGALYSHGVCPEQKVERGHKDTLVIAVDGGFVPDRGTKGDFEAKVGVVYGAKASVSKDRVELVDRAVYAGIEDSTTFGRRMSVLAMEAGMLACGRTILIGDGAGWIRTMAKDVFPDAVYVLDLYHLKHRIRRVYPDECDLPVREEAVAACLAGDPKGALAVLRAARPSPEREEAWRSLLTYLRNNAAGIANYTRTDLFGSGCVEKAVDVVISRRFKLRGMSWLRPGAQGMVKLRMLRYNDTWDDHWGSRFAEAA